jgi:hypothetical protein
MTTDELLAIGAIGDVAEDVRPIGIALLKAD